MGMYDEVNTVADFLPESIKQTMEDWQTKRYEKLLPLLSMH